MLLSIKRCSGRHGIAPAAKTMLLSDWHKTVLLPPKQCSCRQNNAHADKTMLPSTPQCSCGHAPVDKLCSGRHSMVPVDKNMLMSTKQCSCRQNSASVDKTMLMSTKQCSRRHHNAPVGMLLSIKLCSGRHSMAPVDKTMLRLENNAPVGLGQNSAPAAKTTKPRYSCGHAPVDKAPVDETLLRTT